MGSIISVGHDMIEIERVGHAIEKYGEKFLQKIYTPAELRYAFGKVGSVASLAARFAAKEAISKAFLCGIGRQFRWRSASIIHQNGGAPEVILDTLGTMRLKELNGQRVIISLTHTRSMASAVALVI
ncbi:MAG: holo-ACP synthase [Puniceicoccales bacterium]|jgi:holo-[acyl-carrier protein] synthase|nr:holo-ACP synthase [Puniceicoccales bacterium]